MKTMTRRQALWLAAAAGAAPSLSAMAQATFPSRPLRIVVPFPVGGGTDSVGRLVAEQLRAELGQPVVVENRPGAGTLLGASQVARSPADGYSLLVATSTTLAISPAMYPNPAVTRADFAPIAMIGGVTLLLITRPDFPAHSLAELVDEARKHPGKYNFASPGTGTIHHLLFEMLKVQQKVAITHVPYQGSIPALTDVMTGRVDFMFIDVVAGIQQIKAGNVKLVAVNASQRLPGFPNVPTLPETYPQLDIQAWQSIVAPKGTPSAITQRLNAAINRGLATKAMRDTLASFGVEANPLPIDALDALIARDATRFAELVRLLGNIR